MAECKVCLQIRVIHNKSSIQILLIHTGFDMAYIQNGYVYHTEFDSFKVYPKASLQNTGDNVLSLAKSLGNAPEMRNIVSSGSK